MSFLIERAAEIGLGIAYAATAPKKKETSTRPHNPNFNEDAFRDKIGKRTYRDRYLNNTRRRIAELNSR